MMTDITTVRDEMTSCQRFVARPVRPYLAKIVHSSRTCIRSYHSFDVITFVSVLPLGPI